jgi:hypothetical protein
LTAKNCKVDDGGGGGGGLRLRYLSCVEGREEQEEAEGHDEDVGLVARHAQRAHAFARLPVAQLVVKVLP